MAHPDSTDTAQPVRRGGEAAGGAERQAEDPSLPVVAASAADSPFTEAKLGSFDKRNPRFLLNLFSVLSVLSVVLILLLAGYGIYRVFSDEMISAAEHDAVAVAQAIYGQEQKVLSVRDPGGSERIRVAREEFAGLDERMRKYLHPFNIFKIKVFSSDKTIVYSTDHAIIGKVDSDNVRLARVLQSGTVDSQLQSKDKIADLAGEERFDVEVVETYLPIRAGDVIIGGFEVYIDVSHARKRIATMFAFSASILLVVLVVVFAGLYVPMRTGMLWLKQAQDELHVLATIDSLTGLFNRRHLLDRVREESARMSREAGARSLPHVPALLMVDIDHFKRINDEHGHPIGDAVLREVSSRLKRVLRPYDMIGRYGGEEFLVMLPRTAFENAKKVAERMCAAIRATPILVAGKSVRTTVSIGVAASGGSAEDMFDAIRRADAGLYKAKNAGRDRVA